MRGPELITLGCRLNIAESERMRGMLAGEDNLVVINSCAVTSEAVRQTRQAIRKARRARPNARLLVTGCAADIEREQLADMPEVDGLITNKAKLDPRRSASEAKGLSSRTRMIPLKRRLPLFSSMASRRTSGFRSLAIT